MDYVVGSVADLISGNVTPNRPKIIKRALTPTKHQQSPNITPKSEMVSDRTVFLSPSLQKKKAIIKKSPKRIFENTHLDKPNDGDTTSSPKADKVKKHLKSELEKERISEDNIKDEITSPKKHRSKSTDSSLIKSQTNEDNLKTKTQNNGVTPKNKKQRNSVSDSLKEMAVNEANMVFEISSVKKNKSKKNKKQTNNVINNSVEIVVSNNDAEEHKSHVEKCQADEFETDAQITEINNSKKSKKKNEKNKFKVEENKLETTTLQTDDIETNVQTSEMNKDRKSKKKNKKRKNSIALNKEINKLDCDDNNKDEQNESEECKEPLKKKKKKQNKTHINPNAITDKDTDSEHDSDNDIPESDNEQSNKKVLDTGPTEDSSDDEQEQKPVEKKEVEVNTEEELKRTLFVGNVPFNKKCKKEIKKIFSKYGEIVSVRIRTIPVKDGSMTPKMAVIKSELHPDRSTVNVYVKFADPASVGKALVENNTILHEHHLRVSRSNSTGAEHDPKCAIFVGNIPFTLEDETLRSTFEKCGEIASVRIVRDRKTNAGKGFGYVNFASKDGVELALNLSEEDLTIRNRILRVKRCTQFTQQKKQTQAKKDKGRKFVGNSHENNSGQEGQSQNKVIPVKFGRYFQKKYPQSAMGEQVQNQNKDGAFRRIMKKRPQSDNNEGPPSDRANNFNQPNKDKKIRKDFVGMTAEKKKKQTSNKGQKKKKILSEILTK